MSLQTLHKFHRLGQLADSTFESQLDKLNVTARQAHLLGTIQSNPGASQTFLVEKTNVDRSTLSDIVRRTTKKGLTKRTRSTKDARAYNVTLTSAGERVASEVSKIANRITDDLLTAAKALGVTVRN